MLRFIGSHRETLAKNHGCAVPCSSSRGVVEQPVSAKSAMQLGTNEEARPLQCQEHARVSVDASVAQCRSDTNGVRVGFLAFIAASRQKWLGGGGSKQSLEGSPVRRTTTLELETPSRSRASRNTVTTPPSALKSRPLQSSGAPAGQQADKAVSPKRRKAESSPEKSQRPNLRLRVKPSTTPSKNSPSIKCTSSPEFPTKLCVPLRPEQHIGSISMRSRATGDPDKQDESKKTQEGADICFDQKRNRTDVQVRAEVNDDLGRKRRHMITQLLRGSDRKRPIWKRVRDADVETQNKKSCKRTAGAHAAAKTTVRTSSAASQAPPPRSVSVQKRTSSHLKNADVPLQRLPFAALGRCAEKRRSVDVSWPTLGAKQSLLKRSRLADSCPVTEPCKNEPRIILESIPNSESLQLAKRIEARFSCAVDA